MRRTFLAVAGVVLATPLVLGGMSPQTGATGAQKVDPAVAKVRDAYVAAAKARDASKIAELYEENAVEMPPNEQPLKGRAAIRGYYEKLFKGEEVVVSNLRLQSIASRTTGDIAYDVGTYRQDITMKGGKPTEDSGNYTVILHRAADGQWRVAYAIYNTHLPPTGQGRQ